MQAGVGRLEVGEARDERGFVVSRSDDECLWVEEQEGVVDVRETGHIQFLWRDRLTSAVVGPRLVIPDGTLRRGASLTRWAYNGVASILTTFTAEVGGGSAIAELTAADIERAVFVSWKGIDAALANGGV